MTSGCTSMGLKKLLKVTMFLNVFDNVFEGDNVFDNFFEGDNVQQMKISLDTSNPGVALVLRFSMLNGHS